MTHMQSNLSVTVTW